MYISKRAGALEYLKNAAISLWKIDRGPFENILGLASYVIPFVPGGGWGLFILEKILSLYGYGADDLGREIDQFLGLKPGSEIMPQHEKRLEQFFNQKLKTAMLSDDEEIRKQAGIISGLVGIARVIPKLAKFLMTAVKVFLLAFSVSKMKDLYTYVEQHGAAGLAGGVGALVQNLPGLPHLYWAEGI